MRAWTELLLSDVGRPKPCFTQSLLRPLFKKRKGGFFVPLNNKNGYEFSIDSFVDGLLEGIFIQDFTPSPYGNRQMFLLYI